MIKSRRPEFVWSDSYIKPETREAIQKFYIKALYEDLLEKLIKRRPKEDFSFKEPPSESLKGTNSEGITFIRAEKQTICHIVKFLSDLQDSENYHPDNITYLFQTTNAVYDFPANYWLQFLKVNDLKEYRKHKGWPFMDSEEHYYYNNKKFFQSLFKIRKG